MYRPGWTPIGARFPSYARWRMQRSMRWLPRTDVDRHVYLTGKTGTGKSSLMELRVYEQWWRSRHDADICIVVIDPHGDMVQKMRKLDLAKKYPERLVYVDPLLRKGYVPCLNPFDTDEFNLHKLEVYTQQLVQVFQAMIPDAKLSNYMRTVLTPCIATLLQLRTCGFQELVQFMQDEHNERLIEAGKRSRFPSHRVFFAKEFMHPRYGMTKGSIITKVQSLLNTTIFSSLMTGKRTIKLEQLTRTGKIILFNLSKGKLGHEVSEVVGRCIIAQLVSIAFSRAHLPPHARTPIYLLIDEADSFIHGKSLEIMLKETRKYGLSLFLATQNLVGGHEQERLKRNLLNNTQIKLIGANGLSTLSPLAKETMIPVADLQALKPYTFWLKNGYKPAKQIRLPNVLGGGSGVLLNRHQVRSLNDRMVKRMGYYKPMLTGFVHPEERVSELPPDLHEHAYEQASPKARFTLHPP